MHAKNTLLSILGLMGMGPMPGFPDLRSKPPHVPVQADFDRIEEAKQKRLKKQAKRINKAP